MLEVKNLTKKLPNGRKVLDGISFKVKKGEFVGILGPSGAGKNIDPALPERPAETGFRFCNYTG